jgi:hypothetical protein
MLYGYSPDARGNQGRTVFDDDAFVVGRIDARHALQKTRLSTIRFLHPHWTQEVRDGKAKGNGSKYPKDSQSVTPKFDL